MRKRVAIVSSFNRVCGIASYTSALQGRLAEFCDVEILALDVDLLTDSSLSGQRDGDRHIEDLIARFKEFDIINVHVEHGLYGPNRSRIYGRLKRVFDAAPALCLTIHWLVPKPERLGQKIIDRLGALDLTAIPELVDRYLNYKILGDRLYTHLEKIQKNKYVSIISHNLYDKRRLEDEKRIKNVFDAPLVFLRQEEVSNIRLSATRSQFKQLQHIPSDQKIVGVFGFLAPYKGFEIAIRAMKCLPKNFHLAIFGGLHSNRNNVGTEIDPYLRALMSEVAPLSELTGRVHFCGALSDADFLSAIAICDCVAFPYFEVGLSSSGPISLAVEMGSKIVASRTRAFYGLSHYYPERINLFDIGNHLELASIIFSLCNDDRSEIKGEIFDVTKIYKCALM